MNMNETASRRPLRLWPGMAAAMLLVIVGYVVPIFAPRLAGLGMIGAVVCALIVLLWWLFFSRARWYERLGAIAVIIGAAFAEKYVVHPSIAGGAMGNLAYVLAIPTLTVALVAWAVASRRLAPGARAGAVVVAVVVRMSPVDPAADRWHHRPTGSRISTGAGRRLPRSSSSRKAPANRQAAAPAPVAAELPKEPLPATSDAPARTETPAPAAPVRRAEWPGFRGPERDGVIRGVQIATDWSQSPPVQLWRRAIGPGWSSFAVSGNLLYTQEQRGGDEVVSCYRTTTGEPVWRHRDATRFWESNGGAGPRGTPTLSNGRVYTFGGTGILNVLDAISGAVVWSRNAASDVNAKTPMWGFSSSPLVVGDVVIVAAGGKLAAYDVATGAPRWTGGGGGLSYSSPHLVTIDGVEQVVFMSGPGTTSVAPATGKVLWEYAWSGGAIVQPAVTPDGDILVNTISMNGGVGLRRISIAHDSGWTASERWTSNGLKPYFNDFVVHNGHAYGFDGNILSCIDLQDGTRKWKGGRYGNGQLLLLADQDLLLVLSEEGDLALVKAASDQFTEVGRFPAALDGKTWNHPVVVRDVLLVRNDHEMAAFRLSRP